MELVALLVDRAVALDAVFEAVTTAVHVHARAQRNRILRTVGQLRPHCPVAHRGVGADAVELAIRLEVHARPGNPLAPVLHVGRLVVEALVVEAEIDVPALGAVFQRDAKLAGITGLVILQNRKGGAVVDHLGAFRRQRRRRHPTACGEDLARRVRSEIEQVVPPLVERVRHREVGPRRREAVGLPLELVVGLEVEPAAEVGGDRQRRRGQEGLLELHAGRGQALQVHRHVGVDAADHEQALAPAHHLVAEAHAAAALADVEFLAHPQVVQAHVLADRALGVTIERGARGVVGDEVVQPAHPAHELPLVGEAQQQLVRALEVGGEEVALVVVEVAVVAVGPHRGIGIAAAGRGNVAVVAALAALHALAEARGQRGIERTAHRAGLELEGVRRRCAQAGHRQPQHQFLQVSRHDRSPQDAPPGPEAGPACTPG